MGYDMYIAVKDDTEEAVVTAARTLVDAACKQRDTYERGTEGARTAQEIVDALLGPLYALPSDYFRLNIWGMGATREAMYGLGMLDAATLQLQWPEREDFDVDDAAWNAWDGDEPGQDAPEGLHRYYQAHEKALAHRPEKPTGICAFKFGSNDGWLVTPDELAAALAAYDEAAAGGASVPESEWWADWIGYLRRAQARGGFRVH